MARIAPLRLSIAAAVLLFAPAAWAEDILDDLDTPPPASSGSPGSSEDKKPATAEPEDPDAKPKPAPKPPPEGDPEADPEAEQPKPGAEGQPAPASLDRIKAVPRKEMLKRGRVELTPFVSFSMNDPYFQHFAGSATAVFYPHDAFGFGLGFDYLWAHPKTSNVDVVRKLYTSVPAVFEKPFLFAHFDGYWVPIYGKVSLFDNAIIHFDTYAVAGMGVAMAGQRTPPLASLGIGQRFVLSDWMALRFEVRDHLFLDNQEVSNPAGAGPAIQRSDVQSYVMFQAGVSLFVPPSFEYGGP